MIQYPLCISNCVNEIAIIKLVRYYNVKMGSRSTLIMYWSQVRVLAGPPNQFNISV